MSSEMYVESPVLMSTLTAVGAGLAVPGWVARHGAQPTGAGGLLCLALAFAVFGAGNVLSWPTAREQGFARSIAIYSAVLVLPAQLFAAFRLRGLPGLAVLDGCYWLAAAATLVVLLDALRLSLRSR